jgi:hypothetical protein
MYKEKIQTTHWRQSVKTSSDGYTRLAAAILAQAYRDTKSVDAFKRLEALDYLRSAAAANLAELIGFNPERLKKWVKNASTSPRMNANIQTGDYIPLRVTEWEQK